MEMTAPKKEDRIAAHRAPKVRLRDHARALVFVVRVGAWACWKHNRRLFWVLAFTFSGLTCLLAGLAMLVIGALL